MKKEEQEEFLETEEDKIVENDIPMDPSDDEIESLDSIKKRFENNPDISIRKISWMLLLIWI